MKQNRRIIVAAERHNDILKLITGDKRKKAQNTQAGQIRKDKLSRLLRRDFAAQETIAADNRTATNL